MEELDPNTVAVLGGGGVEYALENAAVEIDALIATLVEAKEDEATHVVLASGNYRGAKWECLDAEYTWAGDE